MAIKNYNNNVFINCPLDDKYNEMFYAIIFCIFDCGFIAKCALENVNHAEVRINKIYKIIQACKYGIHDISRTEFCKTTKLPRFNMPLELGIFLGAKQYGASIQKKKVCLILDRKWYRYQKFISDIAGQDIQAHKNDSKTSITIVRNWLRDSSLKKNLPGGGEISKRYNSFIKELPKLCENAKIKKRELTFNDYCHFITEWLKDERNSN